MNELAIQQNKIQIHDATEIAGASPSVSTVEMAEAYIEYIDKKPATKRTYACNLKQYLKYLYTMGIDRPTRRDVIAYRDSLIETHKPSTIKGYLMALKQFYKWTATTGLYPNIAQDVEGVKLDRGFKKDYLSMNGVKAILEGISRATEGGKRDYALMALMVTCGLRTIEVHRANVEDLRARGAQTVLYVQGKGRDEKGTAVNVPAGTEQAIREYLMARKADDGEPLFTSTANSNRGERLTTRSIRGIAKKYMRKAGYDSERLTAHSLRHTAVTLALDGGASLQEAKEFARHSDINTTLIYAHNLEEERNSCSGRVADMLFS